MTHHPPDDAVRLTDGEREDFAVAAVRIITEELAELVALRGNVALATTILTRGGDPQLALKALRGEALI